MTMLDAPTGQPVADPTAWSWRITWRGRSWTDNDLTGQHVAVLAILSGGDEWADLDVDAAIAAARAEVVAGYMRLMNMLCALLIVDEVPDSLPENVAQERTAITLNQVRKASADEILGAFSVKG